MTSSVADRITHRLPRPISCNCCGSPRVHLQKRALMGMRVTHAWDLVWHCLDCLALVGCHEGTDIPLGLMADTQTREARFQAHKTFDRLWRGGGMSRRDAYIWMSQKLMIPLEAAHIGMLSLDQCEQLVKCVQEHKHTQQHRNHWSQKDRKRRRK